MRDFVNVAGGVALVLLLVAGCTGPANSVEDAGCTPACIERECGDDGCGGNCGLCDEGMQCSGATCVLIVAGDTECVPDCEGKECGDDGCGGNCGDCESPMKCLENVECIDGACDWQISEGSCFLDEVCLMNGQPDKPDTCVRCVADVSQTEWTPLPDGTECGVGAVCFAGECCDAVGNCEGMQCGDDGCGGACGECPDNYQCQEGLCIAESVGCDNCMPWQSCVDDSCKDPAPLGVQGSCSAVSDECHGISEVGCCLGSSLYYCASNSDCPADLDLCLCAYGCSGTNLPGCGWDKDEYKCMELDQAGSDPSGDHPWQCYDICEPECDGKECGEDGCGGFCGECPEETFECIDGICECPGEECAESCCPAGHVCAEGDVCCEAQCQDKECGPDGCGGQCGYCSDGDVCNGVETCVDGTCEQGEPKECDDKNSCTDDSCDPQEGCQNVNNTAGCDDGDACTADDLCSTGECVPGSAIDCDDGNPCTEDDCDSAEGCVSVEVTGDCDDGNACTTGDTCTDGQCVAVGELDCNDENLCTDDSCDSETGCVHEDNTADCDDGNPCTTLDVCGGGECGGTGELDCDDGDPCTDDACVSPAGCEHVYNSADCDDNNQCTTDDNCVDGGCVGSGELNCDDANPCTDDGCSADEGCVHDVLPDGSPCPGMDGFACVGGECNCAADCVGKDCGPDSCGGSCGDCEDEHACTEDACTEDGQCTFIVNPFFCLLDGFCLPSGTENPENGCLKCLPNVSKSEWSPVENGTSCGAGKVCFDGVCCDQETNCDGKDCGDDGCGGTCGQCPEGQWECDEGSCVCVPACEDKECGPDGCGGSCGGCQGEQDACLDGACVCQSDCEGKECGADGCGSSCGQCQDGFLCLEDTCQPEPGIVVITEIFKDPTEVPDDLGEWFELYNTTDEPIDLGGWALTDAGVDSHIVSDDGQVSIGPQSYLVLGNEGDSNLNGGVDVDYVYDHFFLSNKDDEVILSWGEIVVDAVYYDDGVEFPDTPGTALSLALDNLDATSNDSGANWCEAVAAFGAGDNGSPGEANPACPKCGDEVCDDDETCETCSEDCWCDDPTVCFAGTCCTPNCEGKECGYDGCGGTCGACDGGTVCHAGSCEDFLPNCLGGFEPSAEGCVVSDTYEGCCDDSGRAIWCQDGDTYCVDCAAENAPECGWYPAGQYYICGTDGSPDPSGTFPKSCCVPDCAGKECGADGCGGSCGDCGEGSACGMGGLCLPTCYAPLSIACNGSAIANTAVSGNTLNNYSCTTWNESGQDIGYVFMPEIDDSVDIVLTAETADLDLFVLDGVCLAENCLGHGDTSVAMDVEAGKTYFIVVDGFEGQTGPFTLTVECASSCVPECDGKECGFDGCFGECGECEEGDVCVDDACQAPTCTGACGDQSPFGCFCDEACFSYLDCCDDVCDVCPEYAAFDACVDLSNCGDGFCNTDIFESCSNCPEDCACGCGEECLEGECAYVACDGRECGDDGCGMSCGSCGAGYSCLDGACVDNHWEICDIETVDVCVGNTVKECSTNPWVGGMSVIDCSKYDTTCEYTGDILEYDCLGCGSLGAQPVCDGNMRMYCDVINDNMWWEYCKWNGDNYICKDGDCVCVPQCEGMQCGADGCGGACGECDSGMKCDDGQCLHVVGASCQDDSDCVGAGDWPICGLEEDGWTGGYCTSLCESYGAGPCPQGSTCYQPMGVDYLVCYDDCNDDGDCRPGYNCDPAFSVCLPCGADEVADCDGNCAPLDWLGDGVCDEGQFGANLNCEAHAWDLGDCCEPPCEEGFECVDGECVEGACLNAGDEMILQDDTVNDTISICNVNCFFDGGAEGCAVDCITSETGLSEDCASCHSELFDCTIDNCFGECIADPESETCVACKEANCYEAHAECSGIDLVPSSGLVINEFIATPTNQEAIELYNPGANPVDITGWTFNYQMGAEVKSWGMPSLQIAGGAFFVLNADNLIDLGGGNALVPNNGATMWIADAVGGKIDEVAYGTAGPAPAPIYATSTARVSDGADNDDFAGDFNWDATPTLGAANDVSAVALGSSDVVVSEVFMNQDDDDADFIELDVVVDSQVDVSGWTMVILASGSDDYLFAEGSVLAPGASVIEQPDFPLYANELSITGVIYLYDANGVRRHQVGWDGLAEDGSSSLGYAPGDTGAIDCYDTATCGLSVLTPTKGEENQL